MHKKLFILLFVLTVCLSLLGSEAFTAAAQSRSEIAVELTTGTVLTQNNADVKLPMASTTKIMTAIIIIEDCNPDDVIRVPDEAVGVEGSSVYLKKNEEIDIRDLLYGLMLRSGNDCATALALHHSGSVEKFAECMNAKARDIGAYNTNFVNPSGLPDGNHYTTAKDLCLIACYAMKNEQFKQVVSTKNYKGKYRSYINKNKMLTMCDGANGVKTGYTVNAGRCLVSSAERNGMDVVCVVLNCPDMYNRSIELIDWCFDRFELVKLDPDKVFMLDNVLCKTDKRQSFIVNKDEELKYEIEPTASSDKDGSENLIAKLKIYGQNRLLFTADLYSIIDR